MELKKTMLLKEFQEHQLVTALTYQRVIMMPSYVNIGAYVDEGTMVDTWAVGSCAQIGKNVHLSGGVGIGGVLEPLLHQ
jgi:2,3,4,5-tetrahydropyridine-2,6-dicarboxylate N-succinyltransferase